MCHSLNRYLLAFTQVTQAEASTIPFFEGLRLQILGESGRILRESLEESRDDQFSRECLTRHMENPIIVVFWQPSRSLPALIGKPEIEVQIIRSRSSGLLSGCRAIGSEGRVHAPTTG